MVFIWCKDAQVRWAAEELVEAAVGGLHRRSEASPPPPAASLAPGQGFLSFGFVMGFSGRRKLSDRLFA